MVGPVSFVRTPTRAQESEAKQGMNGKKMERFECPFTKCKLKLDFNTFMKI